MIITWHAERRAQQRGISDDAIQAAVTFGRMESQRNGRKMFYLDRKSVDRACREWGGCLEEYLNTVVVMSPGDGHVITVGRFRNLRRMRQYRRRRRIVC